MFTQYLRPTAAILAVVLVSLQLALAQEEPQAEEWPLTPEEQQALEELYALWENMDRQTGDIVLADGLATLRVPEDYFFLGTDDAVAVLVGIWGNPPGQVVLGMLMPAHYTPFDWDSWAVTIAYENDGHVSDEDVADIDYDELLEQMQEDTRAYNPERESAGYEPIELVGWAEPPHYDVATRKLYWAKELQFGEDEETTLNYEIRALGRTGMLSMTFIASTSQLPEINASRETVLAMAEFNAGNRYDDYDPSVDQLAAYGVGALVAGKVAAKTGLLAALLMILKKFGAFILIGIAVFWRKLFGMFRSTETLGPQ